MDVMAVSNKIRIVMDATTFTAFQSCEEFFNLKHNHNLVPITGMGKPIEKGSMMHHMLETFYKAKAEGDNRSARIQKVMQTAQLFIMGCELCMKNECKEHKDNPYKGITAIDHEEAHSVVDTFTQYEEFWKNDSWTTLAVEYVGGAVIYEDDDLSLLWKAKMDWIVDTDVEFGIPVDHKTASRRDDVSSLDNQFIGQTIIQKSNKMYRNVVGWQTSLKPQEKFTREAVNYSKSRQSEWILEAASYAYDLAAAIDAKRYRHRFTSCRKRFGDCIFRKICEGEPTDRARLIMEQFRVNDRVWDISND